MHKYTKIETVFERDTTGTKKLIDGHFRDETVEYLQNNLWLSTEKIDGTNIGIVWDGHKVTYQGRTEKADIPAALLNKLIELFGGDTNEELFEQKFGEMPVILFGEGYGGKIQKVGKLYSEEPQFALFDVYLPEKNLWLKWEAVENIATTFGINTVPVVMVTTLNSAIRYVKSKPVSSIGTAPMEGLVCRPLAGVLTRTGERVIVKIKAKDFE